MVVLCIRKHKLNIEFILFIEMNLIKRWIAMKKLCLVFAVMLTVLLAGCGEMSQQDVVDK